MLDQIENRDRPVRLYWRVVAMKMKVVTIASLLAASALCASVGNVEACPSGQYSWMGMCVPNGGNGTIARSFEHLKKEIPAQLGGLPLEQWISQSHTTAMKGAIPI